MKMILNSILKINNFTKLNILTEEAEVWAKALKSEFGDNLTDEQICIAIHQGCYGKYGLSYKATLQMLGYWMNQYIYEIKYDGSGWDLPQQSKISNDDRKALFGEVRDGE